MRVLNLTNNDLTTLADGVFDGLAALETLNLRHNQLQSLPDGVFEPLTALTGLTGLDLRNNRSAPFAPTADAQPDDGTVSSAGGRVPLDGSGSDGGPWGMNVTYGWALTDPTSGVTVRFDDDASVTPEARIPALAADTELTFTLTVTGRGGEDERGVAPAADTAKVTVVTVLPDPTAGVCGRTPAVRDALIDRLSVTSCGAVSDANLASITNLSLSGQDLTALAAGDFAGLTSLGTLYLTNTALTTLPDGVFDGLNALTNLVVNGTNTLTALSPGAFAGLTSLTYLWLDNNGLENLPDGVFSGLTSLTDLRLDFNGLTALSPGAFAGLTSLKTLRLENNELATLPDDVFEPLTALTTLDLLDNDGAPFSPEAVALPDDGTVPVAGGMVPLDGSDSGGAWGTNVTYGWALTDPASGVTFDDDASPTPEVTIPALTAGTELTFTLTVTGRGGTSGIDPATDIAKVTSTASDDATLGALTVTDGTGDLTLDPTFAPGTFAYAAEVDKAVTTVTLTAMKTDDGASVSGVTLNGNAIADSDFTNGITVPSLLVGDNDIVVTVTAENGASQTYTVTVTRTNSAPTASDGSVTTDEDTAHTFAEVEFNFVDSDGGDALASVTVVTLPAAGALELNGTAVMADQSVLVAGIGDLVFTPEANANGMGYASFTFKVSDGTEKSALAYIMTVNVTAVNDPATGMPTISGTARVGETLTAVTTGIADADGPASPTYGYQWIRVDADGTSNATDVVGETADTYVPVEADDGKKLRVKVRFTDDDSTDEELTSDAFPSSGTIEVSADICGRTGVVRRALLALISSVSNCADVTATHLTAIGTLDLSPITALAAGDFAGLTSLIALRLDNNNLTTLPDGVFAGLTALRTLRLEDNRLTTLPAGVFDGLTALRTLRLEDNFLATLPDGVFAGLTALRMLTLQRNRLTTLPAGVFDGLTALTTLGLYENSLTTLPAGVFDGLTALETLYLYDNSLTTLPAGVFDGLTALTTLALSDNSLTRLRAGVFDGLTALETLILSDNSLTWLPAGVFAELTALTGLSLTGNDGAPFAPEAVALPDDGTVSDAGGTVPLDGSGSGGAWGTNVTYGWALTTPASGATFNDNTSPTPEVTIEALAPYTELTFTLTVTGRGGTDGITPDTDTATVTATGPPASDDATLSGLTVNDGTSDLTLDPTFASAKTSYAAEVANAVTTVTLTATVNHTGASVSAVTLDGTAITDNDFTDGITVPSLLVGDNAIVVTVTAENGVTQTYTVRVTQAAGALALTLGVIAGDGTVNIAEKAAGFEIGGDTGTEAGVGVTVEIGGETLTTTSADDAGTATWTVSVPADAAYISGTSVAVEVNASKTGYSAPAAITRTLTVDLAAPTAPGYSAPASLKVGEAITALNPSGGIDIAEYSATDLPSGLTLNTGTGVIGGTPEAAGASTATATVTVRDAAGNTATATIIFPAVDKGDQALTGFQYSPSSVTYGSGTVPSVTAPTGVLTTLSYLATPDSECTVDPTSGALTLLGAGDCEITATAAGSDDYNEATVGYTVTVQAAGALVLNLGVIAGDGTVNIAEKAAGFEIGGDTGTETRVGVTVEIGGETLTTTSADNAGTATWTVSVPADAAYISGTSVAVEVNASKTGYSAPAAITRSLAVDLTAPTAPGYSAPASLKVGEAITSMSPSGGIDVAEYGAAGLPSGLTLNTGTGVIGGTPDTADASTATATVTVGDAAGNTATATIIFPAVDKGDQALTGFQYSPSSVTYGSGTVPSVTAPTGVLTTLSYLATPADVCTVDPTSGALTLVGAGDCVIAATAAGSDDYNEAIATYPVTVQAAGALALTLGAIAGDGTVNIAEKAAGFEIGGDTGTEAGVGVTVEIGGETLTTTSADDAGTATWTVSVPADAAYISGTSVAVEVNASKTGYSAPAAITRTLTVDLAAPTAPGYSAPASLKVGEAITSMNSSGGVDIDEYSATDLPSGLTLNTGTGVISGTPEAADVATATATVTVRDAAGNTATATIIFPAVDKGDQALTGFQYSASSVSFGSTAPTVTVPTGAQTTLGYSAEPSTVCSVDDTSGALTLDGVGTCTITATAEASDNYNEASVTFDVTVQATGLLVLNVDDIAGDDTINIEEKASGFDISGNTGSEGGVSVTVTVGGTELTATSADADPATWTVNVPVDATYITGTSVDVTVSASKAGYTSPSDVTGTLTVDLTAPTAPTYAAPASLQVDVAITSMSPSGGVDIDAYAVTDLPSGLSMDTSGVISGTPDKAEANTATVTITVSDAAGNTATATIIFPAVDKGDQALTGFQYSPSSVTYGSGTVPSVTAPTGVLTTLSYLATPDSECTVDPTSGALTLLGAGDCEITATAAGSDDYNEATVGYTVTVQAAGALVLNLGVIAGDGTVNIAEKAAGFEIGGDTGTETRVGVTVEIGGETLTTTSADNAGTATWTVSVPADAAYISGTSVAVEVNASKTGYSAPAAITRSLAVDLTAPTAPGYSAPASLKVGEAITSMSPSGGIDVAEYGAAGLPSGLTLNTGTGVIGGTPDTADASTATATVTVGDAAGNTATATIIFPAVDKGDQALTGFQYSPSSVTYGSATVPSVTAPTGVLTTLSYLATPDSECTVDPTSGALTLLGAGDCEITATPRAATTTTRPPSVTR